MSTQDTFEPPPLTTRQAVALFLRVLGHECPIKWGVVEHANGGPKPCPICSLRDVLARRLALDAVIAPIKITKVEL